MLGSATVSGLGLQMGLFGGNRACRQQLVHVQPPIAVRYYVVTRDASKRLMGKCALPAETSLCCCRPSAGARAALRVLVMNTPLTMSMTKHDGV